MLGHRWTIVIRDGGQYEVEDLIKDRAIYRPNGLERALSVEEFPEGVTVEQLRAACDRYAARKTTVPGSYANRHYLETGHAFGFGCCLGTEA